MYGDILKKIQSENPKPVSDEAIRLLLKIADNILKNPTNVKLRTLQKNNATLSKKILSAKGAVDCLTTMGFQENKTSFIMPMTVSLTNLQKYRDEIMDQNRPSLSKVTPVVNATNVNCKGNANINNLQISKVQLPPLDFMYTNPFLRRIETYFHDVLQYEDKSLQERAKRLIPLAMCEDNAQRRLRSIQEMIKKKKLDDLEISIQDAMILELLKWFKEEFFSWVDSPECSYCGGESTFSHMSTDPNHLLYTNRVELHRCKTCHRFTSFPRYADLNILLETRRGRCGEWANTFTLFCCALGWDARFVVDEGDHVWTEVYSVTQKRWLHCDACENVCDTPLLYQTGWHKKVSYVMAYSADEVQDVTWRYTSNHRETLKLRKNCSEKELLDAIFKLNSIRQANYSQTKKTYLTKRSLNELVEFLTEKKPGTTEQQGRTSGSAVWRLARGEINDSDNSPPFVWQINDGEIVNNEVILKYSASLDAYELISGDKRLLSLEGWSKGTCEHSNVFRKEETDWKMVYLARKEGCELGKISWKIQLTNSSKCIDNLKLDIDYITFENGVVTVEVSLDDKRKVSLLSGENTLTLNDVNSSTVTISVSLCGGKGDVAWQHAQLFRQSSDDDSFPFKKTQTSPGGNCGNLSGAAKYYKWCPVFFGDNTVTTQATLCST